MKDIANLSQDDLWNLIEGCVPSRYLNRWLEQDEQEKLLSELKVMRNKKQVPMTEMLKILGQYGYNINEISTKFDEKHKVEVVRISI